ncbi:MAG TPA: hypothetical protein VFB72_06985 [Verrucomicrobiae bacterium]|nr:hypothetical protein [Verrucomicrobiae bacterium]
MKSAIFGLVAKLFFVLAIIDGFLPRSGYIGFFLGTSTTKASNSGEFRHLFDLALYAISLFTPADWAGVLVRMAWQTPPKPLNFCRPLL